MANKIIFKDGVPYPYLQNTSTIYINGDVYPSIGQPAQQQAAPAPPAILPGITNINSVLIAAMTNINGVTMASIANVNGVS